MNPILDMRGLYVDKLIYLFKDSNFVEFVTEKCCDHLGMSDFLLSKG